MSSESRSWLHVFLRPATSSLPIGTMIGATTVTGMICMIDATRSRSQEGVSGA